MRQTPKGTHPGASHLLLPTDAVQGAAGDVDRGDHRQDPAALSQREQEHPEISRERRLSRKVVRKALRSDKTAFAYKRQHQPRPQLDGHIARLEALLAEELAKPKRECLSYLRLFERLREEGYAGGNDAVSS